MCNIVYLVNTFNTLNSTLFLTVVHHQMIRISDKNKFEFLQS